MLVKELEAEDLVADFALGPGGAAAAYFQDEVLMARGRSVLLDDDGVETIVEG